MRFKDLTDVHARWHAKRVQHDIDRLSVLKIRHVLVGTMRETTPLLP